LQRPVLINTQFRRHDVPWQRHSSPDPSLVVPRGDSATPRSRPKRTCTLTTRRNGADRDLLDNILAAHLIHPDAAMLPARSCRPTVDSTGQRGRNGNRIHTPRSSEDLPFFVFCTRVNTVFALCRPPSRSNSSPRLVTPV